MTLAAKTVPVWKRIGTPKYFHKCLRTLTEGTPGRKITMRQGRIILADKDPNMLAGIRRLLEDEAKTVLMVTENFARARCLHHAKPSGLMEPAYSKPEALQRKVPGIEIVCPEREDECCGFGGTFSVWDPDVSAQMGKDKVTGFNNTGAS